MEEASRRCRPPRDLHAPRGSAVAARRAPATARAAARRVVPVPVREDGETNNRVSAHPRIRSPEGPPPRPRVRRLAPRGDDARVEGLRSQLRRRDGQVPRRVPAGRRHLRRRGRAVRAAALEDVSEGKDAAGRFLHDDYESDEDADAALERTRNDLNEKIAQLNAAIDTFAGEADAAERRRRRMRTKAKAPPRRETRRRPSEEAPANDDANVLERYTTSRVHVEIKKQMKSHTTCDAVSSAPLRSALLRRRRDEVGQASSRARCTSSFSARRFSFPASPSRASPPSFGPRTASPSPRAPSSRRARRARARPWARRDQARARSCRTERSPCS